MEKLFSPTRLGNFELQNHVVMAPMTRSQSTMTVANEKMAKYYAARASAGLIIAEGTAPCMNGLTDAAMPGLFESEHVEGWRLVTEAVHAGGAKIFVQLMHCGRAAHPLLQAEGARLLGPSAIANPKTIFLDDDEEVSFPTPEAMSEADIQVAIGEFAQSAKLAIEAGFDGVEIHAANGYLVDQFLNKASNQRLDSWGGSIENRCRFALAVAQSVVTQIGATRVGIRISPYGRFNGMLPDSEMEALYLYLAKRLSEMNLVYIHIADRTAMGAEPIDPTIKAKIRKEFKGTLILSGGYEKKNAILDLENAACDLVAFGRPFISNPNLVEKMKENLPLLPPNYDEY